MPYAEISFQDKNPLKRWLQRRRLTTAVKLCRRRPGTPHVICDFGAGNGELCKLLAGQYRGARLICYEPAPALLAEARQNLSGLATVEFCPDIGTVPPGTVDAVFCLEVFEHLPAEETTEALVAIAERLRPGGLVVIGVPVEIGIPALYKGVFRMWRRYGAFDASLGNVARAVVCRPPTRRPATEIAPGLRFHHEHLGFDFRRLKRVLGHGFVLRQVSASPFSVLGVWLMPEIYFVAEKSGGPRG